MIRVPAPGALVDLELRRPCASRGRACCARPGAGRAADRGVPGSKPAPVVLDRSTSDVAVVDAEPSTVACGRAGVAGDVAQRLAGDLNSTCRPAVGRQRRSQASRRARARRRGRRVFMPQLIGQRRERLDQVRRAERASAAARR